MQKAFTNNLFFMFLLINEILKYKLDCILSEKYSRINCYPSSKFHRYSFENLKGIKIYLNDICSNSSALILFIKLYGTFLS